MWPSGQYNILYNNCKGNMYVYRQMGARMQWIPKVVLVFIVFYKVFLVFLVIQSKTTHDYIQIC